MFGFVFFMYVGLAFLKKLHSQLLLKQQQRSEGIGFENSKP
jgi:hypothetical protein